MPTVNEPENESLIPERTAIPMPDLKSGSVWLFAAIGLLLAFSLIGLIARAFNGPSVDAILTNVAYVQGYDAFEMLITCLPLGAIVMIWMVLKRSRRRGLLLWCAAMILTVAWFASAAMLPFINHTSSPAFLPNSYPNTQSVVGLVAFGGWLLLANRSTIEPPWKNALIVLSGAGLMVCLIAPIALRHARAIDVTGSVLLAGAFWCLGAFVAERVGINLFQKRNRPADHEPR